MRYLLLAQALYAAAATKNVAARTTDELGAPGARLDAARRLHAGTGSELRNPLEGSGWIGGIGRICGASLGPVKQTSAPAPASSFSTTVFHRNTPCCFAAKISEWVIALQGEL